MAATGILFKGKIYAFSGEYPAELEDELKAQGKNRFGQKTTLSTEEADRLVRGTRGKTPTQEPQYKQAESPKGSRGQ